MSVAEDGPPPDKGTRATLRIAAELAILFGTLLVIDQMFGARDGFASFQPNPYWLPVLVMAIGYGSWPGLAAAGIATLIWLTTNGVRPGGDYFATMFDLSLPPLLWYAAAVVIGEVTNVRNRRIARLTRIGRTGKRNMDRLVDAFAGLAHSNRVLQQRIATEDRTASEILTLSARLPHATGLERQSLLRAMIAMLCRTDDFTCYRTRSDLAWPILFGDGCNRERAPLPAALVAALGAKGRILHAANPADRDLLAGTGLIAVPLLARDGRKLDGVLMLHHLPFASLGPHLIADLTALATWLAHATSDHNRLADFVVLRENSL